MKKILTFVVILSMFILTVTIPEATYCVNEWPPVEEWNPMHPREARPDINPIVIMWDGVFDLSENEPFYLYYGWGFTPTNLAYTFDGDPISPIIWSLQGQTDSAYCLYTVTMNGESLKPTSTFTATCKWQRVTGQDPSDEDAWVIIPIGVLHEYYIEFPDGLPIEDYEIILHGQCTGNIPDGTVDSIVTLHVE
ncbi:MAG: hypothetical protein NWF13_01600 [Candidatus Bathyarchaeota archaeon]|nr:hypothetical protein [Candidatus Bathyarchaeota archaeon]